MWIGLLVHDFLNDIVCAFRWCGGVPVLVSAIVIAKVLFLHNNQLIMSMRLYLGRNAKCSKLTGLARWDCVVRDWAPTDEVEARVWGYEWCILPVELDAPTMTRPRVSVPQTADRYHRLVIEVRNSSLKEDVVKLADGNIVHENSAHGVHLTQQALHRQYVNTKLYWNPFLFNQDNLKDVPKKTQRCKVWTYVIAFWVHSMVYKWKAAVGSNHKLMRCSRPPTPWANTFVWRM